MTDRIPLDHLTSDALDALYDQLEAAENTEAQRQLATAREALASASLRAASAGYERDMARRDVEILNERIERLQSAYTKQRKRAEQAEAALDRVRRLAERWRYTGDRKGTALPELRAALDGPTPGTTAPAEAEHVAAAWNTLQTMVNRVRHATTGTPTPAEERAARLADLAREILYTGQITSSNITRWREQLDQLTDQEQR